MRKTNSARRKPGDDLNTEYRFDYSKAKPNRFAKAMKPGGRLVLLEADVACVFQTDQSVNRVLRSLIASMPTASKAPRTE